MACGDAIAFPVCDNANRPLSGVYDRIHIRVQALSVGSIGAIDSRPPQVNQLLRSHDANDEFS